MTDKNDGTLGCFGTMVLWIVCISLFAFFVFIADEVPPSQMVQVVVVEIDNGLYSVVRVLLIPY